MDWASVMVIAWRRECSERCFPTNTSLTLPPPTPQSALMLVPDYPDLSKLPACYLDLDLLIPGEGSIPCLCLRQAMKDYVTSTLAGGLVRP